MYLLFELSLADKPEPSFAEELILDDLQSSTATFLVLSGEVPEYLKLVISKTVQSTQQT